MYKYQGEGVYGEPKGGLFALIAFFAAELWVLKLLCTVSLALSCRLYEAIWPAGHVARHHAVHVPAPDPILCS